MEHRNRHKKNRPHTSEQGNRGTLPDLLTSGLIGTGGGLLCSLLLLALGTGICLCSSDPGRLILPVGLAALYLSALIGGIIAIRRHGSAPLPCGGLCGGMLLLTSLVLSLFFSSEDPAPFSLGLSLLLRALIPFFSILGARLGIKRAGSPRRKKR